MTEAHGNRSLQCNLKSTKREENKLRQILNKMKSSSDIKQLLKEIKDEPMRYRD